ncbi:efflux RND transporter periplasmic adaptor subunit [Chromobacterium violaceum]|uniref:efflux RND transporter periplasmic adaptor subunit n=1 Tax=Chromobacterium violaceum TaxID=536 RepID=UPI0015F83CB8|nr:efflux RND transporter periplasmic adaptor subunit [Chromobacterium violaceum]MBA8733564.1 efflux RND transporter periplasmic adaptor subunit [Chromobacterium violaceum]
MKRKWLGPALLVAVVALPFVARAFRQETVYQVTAAVAATREIRSSVLASGSLVYQEQAQLSSEVTGKVSAVLVREGDHVRAGQPVLRLDDEGYAAEVTQQAAAVRQQALQQRQQALTLANQQSAYRRKEALHRAGMVADAMLEDARYAVDEARVGLKNGGEQLRQSEAVLAQARQRAAKTVIRAPMSGVVTSIDIKPGETAIASQVGMVTPSLMTIANTGTMLVEANIDEADIGGVGSGQPAKVQLVAYPGAPLSATVLQIPLSPKRMAGAPAGVPGGQARSYPVRLALSGSGRGLLRPGMSCRVEIFTTRAGKALTVPLQAVLSEAETSARRDADAGDGEARVLVVKDGRLESRRVRTGESDDAQQQILSGLRAGERVVTGPAKLLYSLKPGDAVSVQDGRLS